MTPVNQPSVRIDEELGTVVVAENPAGPDLWHYAFGARKRPFVHPLATPAGHVLTRNAPDDHPWHHGLWFTIKFVNGENFWEEYDDYGVLRHVSAPHVGVDGDRVDVSGDLVWIRPDRTTVVIREQRMLTHVPIDSTAYAIDFSTTLVPEVDVVLDRTPFTTWGGYGGLAFRGRPDFHDTRIMLGDGSTHERVLGVESPWLDLSGFVPREEGDGGDPRGEPVGLAVLAAPDSPRSPPPWYGSTRADTYGAQGWSNFFNAAFLWEGPLDLAAGEALSLRYRVVVHDGIWDDDRVGAAHAVYLADLDSVPGQGR